MICDLIILEQFFLSLIQRKVMADVTIEEAAKEEWDLIALPGGMPGAEYLRDCAPLIELLRKQQQQKKLYGAVCASPAVVLESQGLLSEGGATCYPAGVFRDAISNASDDSVVVQDNVITSQGPGTSLLFALSLGEQLFGKEAPCWSNAEDLDYANE